METFTNPHKPCSGSLPRCQHTWSVRAGGPPHTQGQQRLGRQPPQSHMASILRISQLLLLFPRSQGLFLTMAPSQMTDFTEFLPLGPCHRASLTVSIALRGLGASPLPSSSILLSGASTAGGWTHSIGSPASLQTHAMTHSAHSQAQTHVCASRHTQPSEF